MAGIIRNDNYMAGGSECRAQNLHAGSFREGLAQTKK